MPPIITLLQTLPWQRQTQTKINGCNSLGDWTIVSGTPTLAIDATVTRDGDGALKITADEQTYVKLTPTAFNLNGRSLTFAVKVDDLTKLSVAGLGVAIYLYSSAVDYYYIGIAANPSGTYVRDTSWHGVSIHPGDLLVGAGSPNLSAINDIRVMVNPEAGQVPNVWIDDIGLIDNLAPGAVVWTFDDTHASAFTEALPRLRNAGMTGVAVINTANVDGTAALTTDQIKAMDLAGWDIISHGRNHLSLLTLTTEQRLYQLARAKDDLRALGVSRGSRIYLPPGNSWTAEILDEIRQYYDAVVIGLYAIDAPSPKNYGWYRRDGAVTPASNIYPYMDAVKTHGGVLTLMFHDIDPAEGAQQYHPDKLQAQINYAASIGLRSVTFSELLSISGQLDKARGIERGYARPGITPKRSMPVITTGWTALTPVGSAATYQTPLMNRVLTGTTASSSGGLHLEMFGFGGGGSVFDWDRDFYLEFAYIRKTSDAEAVARVQLKTATTIGALAAKGIGIEVNNYALVGEAYGSARGTVALGNLTENTQHRIGIHWRAGKAVDFYLDGARAGNSISAAANIPSSTTANVKIIHTLNNGATGGVDAYSYLTQIRMEQE